MALFSAPDGISLGTRFMTQSPSGGKIVREGWDHEHCDICNKKIGLGDEPQGFFSAPATNAAGFAAGHDCLCGGE
jgi:hypothetical protein